MVYTKLLYCLIKTELKLEPLCYYWLCSCNLNPGPSNYPSLRKTHMSVCFFPLGLEKWEELTKIGATIDDTYSRHRL